MMRGRKLVNRFAAIAACIVFGLAGGGSVQAEDGYDLWLRYAPLEGEEMQDLRGHAPSVPDPHGRPESETLAIAWAELRRELASLQGAEPGRLTEGSIPLLLDCGEATGTGQEGFTLRPRLDANNPVFVIAAQDHIGCLYGSYALLRELSTGKKLSDIAIDQAPAMPLRMLNHWDNPDGHVERGYAGRSIFDWWHLPERLDQRMLDYARANASVGINAVAVNNVNARSFMLEPRYIAKLKRLADAWRPYGIRVFLSARFSAPKDIGGLGTADPENLAVRAWWKAKADEIYTVIPDFGGFLVKANSEGQPGPQDYGRSHSDGANMLAEALGERGTVIWRAFVYSAEDETDRAKQAYAEFVPLDSHFAGNVIVQVKHGPIDFQPREPFHPMFGAMPNTRLMLEAQITKEYLGFASHLAFLAPMWKEALDSDTGRMGRVAKVVAAAGMAGVANTGSDRNWTGSHFDQANWYAFGRLAWQPTLTSERIAREWAKQTFTRETAAVDRIAGMMLGSRETVARYMTPMGLAHLMDTGHHYGPGPWVCDLPRPEWNPCYYHRADKQGIGFDRTATGSDALSQYAPDIAAQWVDPARIDPRLLLWFHHLSWDYRLPSGRTVWEEMVAEYDAGVAGADEMAASWMQLEKAIDRRRFRDVSESLAIQQREARWWRNASLAFWHSINDLPLPAAVTPIPEALDTYRGQTFPEAPGQ